ncbi:methyltransferase domain-containing protein [Chloroflexota bacterium]
MVMSFLSKINNSVLFKTLTRSTLDRAIIPVISEYSKGNVLDVGAMHQPYRKYITCDNYSVLDIRDSTATYHMDIHDTDIPSGEFDTIIATEVLEHLYNPFQAVDEMHRLLRAGGYLIASTRFIYHYHGSPDDYFRFTEHGLDVLFSKFPNRTIIRLGDLPASILDLMTTNNFLFKLLRPLALFYPKGINKKTKAPLGFVVVAQKEGNESQNEYKPDDIENE